MKNSLYNAIANISQSFYDKYVEVNARFRARSGVKTVIVRRELGKCCDWCSQLAGIYNYGEAPDDIYRRHDNCRCMVTVRYEKGTYEDVWSKKEYASQREARISRTKEIEKEQIFWEGSACEKRKAKAAGQRCYNTTEEWLRRAGKGSVIDNDSKRMSIDGVELIIDGKINKFDPDARERYVANLLAKRFGVKVELNPKINNPEGFPLSDYFINQVRFDKKSPSGTGKHSIYNLIKDKEKQAHSFVIDLEHGTIETSEAIRQVYEDVFRSRHTAFVDTIILIEKNENAMVFERL